MSRFTRSAVCFGLSGCGSVTAKTITCSASGPTVMKFFDPLTIQLPSLCFSPTVSIVRASDPLVVPVRPAARGPARDDCGGPAAGFVELGRLRLDLARGEIARRVADEDLVFAELEAHVREVLGNGVRR